VNPTVLGIRHHGPGSARSLLAALDERAPDCVLIEGPSDADALLAWAADPEMDPPVALLAYTESDPAECVFYPFARFSPEWQAARWALDRDVPVRFIDLPAAAVLAAGRGPRERRERPGGGEPTEPTEPGAVEADTPALVRDPIGALARSAGYDDAERWWEDMVEHRTGSGLAVFEAIAEAMGALREAVGADVEGPHEQRREAHMAAQIRAAIDTGGERVAVVCGAWHAPVLVDPDDPPRAPRTSGGRQRKTVVTWVPWTYDRLAAASGYGAGVISPGWYEHLFDSPEQPLVRWLGRVAERLRAHDTDISTAHTVEAARTAQALAALRGRPLAGLPEISDALRAVLGEGSDAMLALVYEELVIGRALGRVSPDVPTVPLQRDLEAAQRRLRLKPEVETRPLELDLRKPNDLERSRLLHRLDLLGLPWGAPGRVTGAKGTFREAWTLKWRPEFAVAIIEAARWGATVPLAATARAAELAERTDRLDRLTALIETALLADLPGAVGAALERFEQRAALSTDLPALMGGLPALARAARYGSVRRTDTEALGRVVAELVVRIAVGLPAAAAAVDDDAADDLLAHVDEVDGALQALDDPALVAEWRAALEQAAGRANTHALIAGRACRLLRDAEAMDADEVARRMHRALSAGTPPLAAAGWLEGFLSGSGLVLVHDAGLLGLVDEWLAGAGEEAFTTVLPVLRRTFATFSGPERRQIGERVRAGVSAGAGARAWGAEDEELDADRAALVLPVLRRLLGVEG
jgi:hypothetical protein